MLRGCEPSRATRAMKELKFTCPSCGQHIQCDWKHAGENVPCPGCATLIRVPQEGNVTDAPSPPPEDNPFAVATGDAEKVSYASAKAADGPEPKKSPATAERAMVAPAVPVTANPAPAPNQESPVQTPAAQKAELHCVCPVCQSALQISVKPERCDPKTSRLPSGE